MCRIQILPDGSRVLNFDPREGGFGKNPAQLPRLPFPHPDKNPHFLAEVIQQIKDSINKLTTEQAEAVKEQQVWEVALSECDTVEKFNAVIVPLMKERDKHFRDRAAKAAIKRGYTANKETKLYEAKDEEVAE